MRCMARKPSSHACIRTIVISTSSLSGARHLDKAEAIRGFQGHSEAFRGDHLLDLDEAMPIDSGRVGIV